LLKVARDLGRLTAGQGELLRRTLGKKDNEAEIARFQAAFRSHLIKSDAW
jgi:DNA polymerase III alpha subunit